MYLSLCIYIVLGEAYWSIFCMLRRKVLFQLRFGLRMSETPSKSEEKREEENVVVFPSSYRYPILEEEGADLVEELLREFEGDSRWKELEEEFVGSDQEVVQLDSNLAYQKWDFSTRFDYLQELQERLAFYLDEIELYSPKKKL